MPADERIKVIFNRLYVSKKAEWLGSGQFYFLVKVDGNAVGDPKQIFDGRKNDWYDLNEATWSVVIDVSKKTSIDVSFHGYDKDAWFDDLGSIDHVLRPPWTEQQPYTRDTEYFS